METYNTIYVDPPLGFGNIRLEELHELPVSYFSAEDAMLFLWFRSEELPESLDVLENWGYRYVQVWSWMRGTVKTDYPYEHLVEHLLVGIRGTVRTDYVSRRNLFDCGRSEGPFHPQYFKEFALAAATRAFSPPRLLDMFGAFWQRRDQDYREDNWHWWRGSLKY